MNTTTTPETIPASQEKPIENRDRCNPMAWYDHGVPPKALTDEDALRYPSWSMDKHPEDWAYRHFRRARGLATFARFFLYEWDVQAYGTHRDGPVLGFGRPEVNGLRELIDVIGESLDLAENAVEAAIYGAEVAK